MYCILNWVTFDDLSLCYNEDGTVRLFKSFGKAVKAAKEYNGDTNVINLDEK